MSKLNPEKHVYMHHNTSFGYDDYFTVGEFPTPEILAEKLPSEKYQNQAIGVVFAWLNDNVEGFNLDAGQFESVKTHSWQVYDVNIEALKHNLCTALAHGLVIAENKNRPNVEKRQREKLSRIYFGEIEAGSESIGDFFDHYNNIVSRLTQSSNFYRAACVPGRMSAIEADAASDDTPVGIVDLNADTPENSNIINRFMKCLHQ